MKYCKVAIITLVVMALMTPNLFGQENRDLWSLSTYIQSAKINYQHVYKKSKVREDLYKSIDLLREAADRFGRLPEVYYMLGTFYAEINAIDTVIMLYDSVEVFCNDATIEEKYRKNCTKKDNYIKKMAALRQDYWEKAYNDGVNYMSQFDGIVDLIAIAPTEDSVKVLDSLKTMAYNLSKDEFMTAVQMIPDSASGWEGLGVIHQRNEEFFEAADMYKKAMSLKGENVEDVSRIAYAYISVPEWDSSITWFEKLLTFEPSDVNSLNNLSIAYSSKGEYDKSFEYTLKILEVDPDNVQALFNAGQFYFMKMQDTALTLAAITDSTPDAKAKRKEIEGAAMGYSNQARESFEKLVQINPEDLDALKRLGILYLLDQVTEGAIDNAISTFEKYVAADPNDKDVLDYLGRAYIQKGEFKGAIRPYELILEIDPCNTDALERLEQLYRHTGSADKADATQVKLDECSKL